MADPSTRIFRASLRGRLYRDLELPSGGSLEDLAAAIVSAFGFDFDHAFGFYSKLKGQDVMRSQPKYELFADMGEQTEAGSVRKTRVADAFPGVGHKMLFMFDYGDEWRFNVELIGLGRKEPKAVYRRVLKRVGEAPAQYPGLEEDEVG